MESDYYLWKWILKIFCSRLESKFSDKLQSGEEKSKQDLLYDDELTQKEDTSLGLLDNMSGEIFRIYEYRIIRRSCKNQTV